MNCLSNLALCAIASFGVVACTTNNPLKPVLARFSPLGLDLSAADVAVAAGDDFFQFANGHWLEVTQIPADASSYSELGALHEHVEQQLHDALERAEHNTTGNAAAVRKLLDVYTAYMDDNTRARRGIKPLESIKQRILAAKDLHALTPDIVSIHARAPFELGIIADPADPTRYIAFAVQSGLGMQEREYYRTANERFDSYRTHYRDYVTQVLTLAGLMDARRRAERVIAFEHQLADVQWSQADSRVVEKIYNPMSLPELSALAPGFDWAAGLSARGLETIDTVMVVQPSAIADSVSLLNATPLAVVKDYLVFHLINCFAEDLSPPFRDAHFAFYEQTLRGTAQPEAKQTKALAFLSRWMGEPLGQLYVQDYFPAKTKAMVETLTHDVIAAFTDRLHTNSWMDTATRAEALDKLRLVEPRIGYPETWNTYASVSVDPKLHVENRMALATFEWQQDLERLAGGGVDRKRWVYPPQSIDAYYDSQVNQITLLAGMLQPPVFNVTADPAVNYGAIGAIIGHELGHGFDSTGRMFDGHGVLRDWWTDAADARYRERERALIDQYSGYEALPGTHIDGALTISENIGDLGG